MLKSTLATLLSISASATFAQTVVTPPQPAMLAPASPAVAPEPAAAGAPAADLPRCSAAVRDRCLQDERFARDLPNPSGSRDNNALRYPTPDAAKRARPTD